jgi:hypothetical protein
MKIPFLITLVGLAISFALQTLAQEQNTVDPEVRQQIEALLIKFGEAFNKHDPLLLQLYTRRTRFGQSRGGRKPIWVSKPSRKAIQTCWHRVPANSSDRSLRSIQSVTIWCVITKDSEGALWKGYKTWICNRDADT